MRRLVQATVLAISLALCGGAGAQDAAPTPEQVKKAAEAFDLGKRAFKDEEFDDAAAQFEAADRHAPNAAALNLAMVSREKAEQLDRAATLAELAKARHPDDKKLVKHADSILAAASKQLHRVTVRCDAACDVVVGTRLQHGGPQQDRVVFLPPGAHSIRAGWSDDRAETRKVTATAGGTSEVSFEQPPVPVAEEPDDEDEPEAEPKPRPVASVDESSGWSPAVFWVTASATAVLAGVTAWSGVDTQSNPGPDTVREKCIGLGESCPEYQDGLSRQSRTNVLAGVTGVFAVGTIVIGAALTDWGGGSSEPAEKERARRPSVEPLVAIGGGGLVGAQGRF